MDEDPDAGFFLWKRISFWTKDKRLGEAWKQKHEQHGKCKNKNDLDAKTPKKQWTKKDQGRQWLLKLKCRDTGENNQVQGRQWDTGDVHEDGNVGRYYDT